MTVPTVATRIRFGVSQAPARAPSQARSPDAAPTAVVAAAAHCMHIAG